MRGDLILSKRRPNELRAGSHRIRRRARGARAPNLHTFGHALEAETGYGDLLHGEAVAVGATLAHDLSAATRLCPEEDAHRVKEHYRAVGLPATPADIIGVDWQTEALISHMRRDKKVKDGRLTFVLTRGIGKAFVTSDVALEDVRTTLTAAISA